MVSGIDGLDGVRLAGLVWFSVQRTRFVPWLGRGTESGWVVLNTLATKCCAMHLDLEYIRGFRCCISGLKVLFPRARSLFVKSPNSYVLDMRFSSNVE